MTRTQADLQPSRWDDFADSQDEYADPQAHAAMLEAHARPVERCILLAVIGCAVWVIGGALLALFV
jgi:hypothetical protein